MGISPLVRRVRANVSPAGALAALIFRPAATHRRHRRAAWIALAAAAVLITTSALAIMQTPIIVANIAAGSLFGVFDSNHPDQISRPPNICAPIPSPSPANTHPDDTSRPAPEHQSRAPLGPDGAPTEETMAIIKQIPIGADVDIATAWILYGLAHPNDEHITDYRTFADMFTTTRATMSSRATPLDVVATIDPRADYSPYLLLAQAAAYRILRQGTLTATDQRTHDLISALARTCAGPDHVTELP